MPYMAIDIRDQERDGKPGPTRKCLLPVNYSYLPVNSNNYYNKK